MRKFSFLLSFIIFIILILSPEAKAQRQQDSLALVALYNATDGPNWTNRWTLSQPMDNWDGVTLENNRVTMLICYYFNLSGNLPSEIGNLSQLTQLRFTGNSQLTGSIPKEIGNLTKLEQLLISYNQLSGNIPSEIGNLSNLKSLQLPSNQLSGNIPSTIGNLSNLELLDLGGNPLGGNIPEQIYHLTNLWTIYLLNTKLTGNISSSIGNLKKLYCFDISGNDSITGSIPTTIGNCTDLGMLRIVGTAISGTLPKELANCTKLWRFDFGWNPNLTGSIPEEFGNLTNLILLELEDDDHDGPIPKELGNLSKLEGLDIKANRFSGNLPSELGNCTNLSHLAVSYNNLDGDVPTSFKNLTKLWRGDFEENDFTSFPDISTVTTLVYLFIQGNRLEFDDIEPNIGVASGAFTYSPQDSVSKIKIDTVCKGQPYTLNITVGGANNRYQWFKNGTAISALSPDSTFTIPSVTSADTGTYYCEITNTLATQLTLHGRPVILKFHTLPKLQITGIGNVCYNSLERYIANYQNGTETQWKIEGGTLLGSSTKDTIDVRWTDTILGIVKLIRKMTSTGCIDSSEKIIIINPLPKPSINGVLSVCENKTEIYTTKQVDGVSNQWFVSGGAIQGSSKGNSISVIWGSFDPGIVKLVQTIDATGCKDSTEIIVLIDSSPKAEITGTNSVCENNITSYSATFTSGTSNQWSVIGGTIQGSKTDEFVTIKWNSIGKGTIKLIQTALNGCKDSAETEITINPLPKPKINGEDIVCSDCIKTYTTSSSSTISNQWSASGGTLQSASNGNSVDVKWGTTGKGTLKLIQTITATGCKDSIIINITIQNSPGINIFGSNSTCENSIEDYSTASISGAVNEWSVVGGVNNGSTTGDAIQVTWGTSGTGSIKLVQTNAGLGFKDSVTRNITINPLPNVTLTMASDVCIDAPAFDLTGGIPSGGTYSGKGIIANQFNPLNAGVGTHNITYVYTSLSGCTDSASQVITAHPLPEAPTITQNGNTLESSAGQGNQWYHEDSVITGATNKDYTPTQSGKYTVEVRDSNGCVSDVSVSYYFDISGERKPQIQTIPASINYKDTLICESTTNEKFEITNIGGQTLIITSGDITGLNANDFNFNPLPSYPINIDSGKTEIFNISFIPQGAGSRNAILSLTSNAINAPNIDVKITGRKDSIGFILSANIVEFKDMLPNAADTNFITIRNTGTLPISWIVPINMSNFSIESIIPQVTQVNNGTSLATIRYAGAPEGTIDSSYYDLKENICSHSEAIILKANVISKGAAAATLQVGTIEGKPGDIIEIPIILQSSQNLTQSGITEFTADLHFKSSLLEPINTTPEGSIIAEERVIPLVMPINPDIQNILEKFSFRVTLGSDSITYLKFDNLSSVGGIALLNGLAGEFRLKGICREGGARLINSTGKIDLMLARPNPTSDICEIEYEVIETGVTKLYITSTMGLKVLELIDGNIEKGRRILTVDVNGLSSGGYFVLLETPTERRVVRLNVLK